MGACRTTPDLHIKSKHGKPAEAKPDSTICTQGKMGYILIDPKLCSKVLELAKGKVAVEVGAEKDPHWS